MTTSIAPVTTLAAWQALQANYPEVRELHLRQLFAGDPKRGERLTAEAVGELSAAVSRSGDAGD